MGSDELLFTLILAGLVLMFIWWGFKSGFFWFIFWIIVAISAIIVLLNIFNYGQTFFV